MAECGFRRTPERRRPEAPGKVTPTVIVTSPARACRAHDCIEKPPGLAEYNSRHRKLVLNLCQRRLLRSKQARASRPDPAEANAYGWYARCEGVAMPARDSQPRWAV
jgi:hypothetical protein